MSYWLNEAKNSAYRIKLACDDILDNPQGLRDLYTQVESMQQAAEGVIQRVNEHIEWETYGKKKKEG